MDNPLEHEWDKLSVEFPLTKDSVVFEIGGYEGRWAKEIAKRYNPNQYVFEPQEWAALKAIQATAKFPKTLIMNYGIGVETGYFPMGSWETDGCSLVSIPSGKPTGTGWIKEFGLVLRSNHIERINLCLMNIEGYEFELIPHMISTGIMDKIDYFMCQFHPRGDAEIQEYHDLRRAIGKKKKIRFDYGAILTCWEPK